MFIGQDHQDLRGGGRIAQAGRDAERVGIHGCCSLLPGANSATDTKAPSGASRGPTPSTETSSLPHHTTAKSSSGASKTAPGRRSTTLHSTQHPSTSSHGHPTKPAACSPAPPQTATSQSSSSRTTIGRTRHSRRAAPASTA